MKGAILEKDEAGHTYLKKLFQSIHHAQKAFNRLRCWNMTCFFADMYTGFWTNPVSIQHPLAELEIVP